MVFLHLTILLANLCILLAFEVEKLPCPDGSSCPIGQACQQTATTGTFQCTSLPEEAGRTGQELVPALASTTASISLRPAFSTNATSSGLQKSPLQCPGTLCDGFCCPSEGAACCDVSRTCCIEGFKCCMDLCCPRESNCCADSYGSAWCCPEQNPCFPSHGRCFKKNAGLARLPSASLLLAVLLMSAASSKYFAGVQA